MQTKRRWVKASSLGFGTLLAAWLLASCSLDFEEQPLMLDTDVDARTQDAQADLPVDTPELVDGTDLIDDLADTIRPDSTGSDLTPDQGDLPDLDGDAQDLDGSDSADVSDSLETDTTVPVTCGWTDGIDLGGSDWTVGDGETIGGRYVGIDHFVVPAGVSVGVAPLTTSSGRVELCARIITIDGEINAAGAGPSGGVGGALNQAAGAGSGTAPGTPGQTGEAASATCRPFDSTAHRPGGPGDPGTGASYSVPSDTSTDDEVWIGSGGGGGGRGGKGGAATCCQRTAAGGAGGDGGAGGTGGGAIVLVATESLTVNGVIKTSGQSGTPGTAGAAGSISDPAFSSCGAGCGTSCPGYDSRYALCDAACTEQECCRLYRGGVGGTGGAGGAGSAGGILLQAPALILSVTSTIEALGGDQDTARGGTVKLRYRGGSPGLSTINAAWVQEAPLLP